MGSNVTKFLTNGPAKLCCKNTEPPVAEGSPAPDDGADGGKSVERRRWSQSQFGAENLRPTSRSPSFKTSPPDREKSRRSETQPEQLIRISLSGSLNAEQEPFGRAVRDMT